MKLLKALKPHKYCVKDENMNKHIVLRFLDKQNVLFCGTDKKPLRPENIVLKHYVKKNNKTFYRFFFLSGKFDRLYISSILLLSNDLLIMESS